MRHTKKPTQSFRHSDKAGKPAHKTYGKPVKKHGDAPTKSFAKPFAKSPAKSMRNSRPPDEAEGRQEKLHQDSILIWGVHAVRAAWLNPKRKCYRLWMTEAGKESFTGFNVEANEQLLKRPDPKMVDRQNIDRLVPQGSVHQGLILETAPLHQLSLNELIGVDPPPDLLLVLDQVTDPHNVGAILRSAEAFGAGGVIMTERNAPDTTGVLAKTASGALDYIPLISVVNLARTLDELHEAGYWSVGLAEEGAKELAEIDLTGRTVLLLGAEGQGLRQLTRKKCHELARLPTGGPIGSLNVSNAAAVALYEVKRQRKT